MGRTNDAILYGGQVHLLVDGGDDAARDLAPAAAVVNSRDYGRPFAEIFRDSSTTSTRSTRELFAPAEVWVSSLDSGHDLARGARRLALLVPVAVAADAASVAARASRS